jgi:dolichol-phosphate mannosyltransferase
MFLTPIRLSVAAPAYNESAGVRQVVAAWVDYLQKHPAIQQFEIVICNDGSTDNTRTILDDIAQHHPEFHPLHFKKNQGAAAALTAAIAATQYEWVLLIDSDDQFPIENFSLLLDCQRRTHAAAIMGIRVKQAEFIARLGSKISGIVCNIIHRSHLKDFNSAFKLVNGTVLRSLVLEARGMNYSTEITSRLLECKTPIAEVSITHRPRPFGVSKMKLMRGSISRFVFVFYILQRQLLIKFGVLKSPLNCVNWQND